MRPHNYIIIIHQIFVILFSAMKTIWRSAHLLLPTLFVVAFVLFPKGLWGQICALNPDGTQLRQLATIGGSVRSLAFSPDGNQITFSAIISGHQRVFLMGSDGKNLRHLGQSTDPDSASPVFTPDGKRILASRSGPSGTGLYLINLDGSETQLFKSGAMNASYSLDGVKLLFNRSLPSLTLFGPDLFVADADGSNERQVPTPPKASVLHASFNPTNSMEIAFTTWGPDTAIWIQNLDGTRARTVSQPSLLVDGASYFPSGKQILYSGMQPKPSMQSALFEQDIGGTATKELIAIPTTLMSGIGPPVILMPIVSPNGKMVACVCGSSGK